MSDQATFNGWCIVELFGHSRIAGHVSEQTIGGTSFVRVDVPAVNGQAPFTKLFGGAAIYAITPTTEEIASLAAANIVARPVDPWVVPVAKQLPSGDGPEWPQGDEE
jgi:hypothetical protein